jgi:hypothetical protein
LKRLLSTKAKHEGARMPFNPRHLNEGESFRTDWGAEFTVQDGALVSQLPILASVGVGNLAEISAHDIVRVAQLTSHTMRFFDGGLLRFAYNDRGQLIELAGQHVHMSIDKEGHVLVHAYRPAGATT